MAFAAIPAWVMWAGMAVSAAGAIYAGMAQAAQYEAQAEAVAAQGRFEKYKLRKAQEAMTSKQRALYAKAGVSLEGSPLNVIADTYAQYEMDIAVNKYNTESKVASLEAAATSSRVSGFLQAGGTMLTGMASMSGGGAGAGAATTSQPQRVTPSVAQQSTVASSGTSLSARAGVRT